MKKICFLFSFIFFYMPSYYCQVQSGLLYNRTLLISTASDTVPSGKVWKVESVLSSSQMAPGLPSANYAGASVNSLKIKINGTDIFISSWLENEYSSYRGHTAYGQITQLPIWLPASTVIQTSANAAFISVIEFNIIP